jgi:hypothetical protein
MQLPQPQHPAEIKVTGKVFPHHPGKVQLLQFGQRAASQPSLHCGIISWLHCKWAVVQLLTPPTPFDYELCHTGWQENL